MEKDSKDTHHWPETAAEAPAPSLSERRRAFGTKLARLREAHGLSVASLAQTTRISFNFINALERGELERLPGEVFGRGFVRSITKSLGEDAEPLLGEFNGLWEKVTPRSVLKVEIKNKPVKHRSDRLQSMVTNGRSLVRRGALVKVVLPIAAAAVAIYALMAAPLQRALTRHAHGGSAAVVPVKTLDLTPPSTTASVSEPSPEAKPVAAAGAGSEPTPPAAPPVEVVPFVADATPPAAATGSHQQVLEIVVNEPVRVKLDVDHGPPLTKELTPDTYRFTFDDRADMMVYDAAAVKISFNGRPLGSLGNKGRVRRLSFQAHPVEGKKL